MAEDADEAFAQKLERAYIPLDPALIRAIIADYNRHDPQQLKLVHEQLDLLQASAITEADSTFDPSGLSQGPAEIQSPAVSNDCSSSSPTVFTKSGSSETDETIDLSGLELEDASPTYGQQFTEFESLSIAEKERCLLEMFPSQDPSSITYTLKKCQGSFGQATDVLLNHVYFQESTSHKDDERINFKSIDAFAESESISNSKKKKRARMRGHKNLGNYSSASSEQSQVSTVPVINHWKTASDDVAFIAQRTGLSLTAVQFLHNRSGGSPKATLRALVEDDNTKHGQVSSHEDGVEDNAAILRSEFPTLSMSDALALIRITKPSTANAHELAKLMTRSVREVEGPIVPHYRKFNLEATEPEETPRSPTESSSTISSARLAQLRSNALNSASSYYRRAASDHLYGGAAAYYGQLGRDYNSQMHAALAAEADVLVASNSTADTLDLHGLRVQDALRITQEKVDSWWQTTRLKEGRSVRERVGNGFTIVTGKGNHSKNRKAQLGPAVFRMLVSKGWKVEVESGLVVVTGKAK